MHCATNAADGSRIALRLGGLIVASTGMLAVLMTLL